MRFVRAEGMAGRRAALLCLTLMLFAAALPSTTSAQPFEIDGNLTATAGGLDWFTGLGGVGSGVIVRATCLPVDALTTKFVRDSVWAQGASDITVFGKTSDKNDACIVIGEEPWNFKSGSGPQKNDITETYATVVVDNDPFSPTFGHTFFVAAMGHRSTNGDNHVDFEINQRGLVDIYDAGSTTQGITVGGPGTETTCGRSLLDQVISVDFGNGGTNPIVKRHEWTETSPGVFAYVEGAIGPNYAAINSSPVEAPCDAVQPSPKLEYGSNYQEFQFIEVAVDLTASGVPTQVLCTNTSTLSVKTRSSDSFTSELKDRVTFPFVVIQPPPCSISDPGVKCEGDAIQLCGPAGAGLTYKWTGTGIPSGEETAQCINPTGLTAGSYQYTLEVTKAGGCTSTCDRTIRIVKVDLSLSKTDVSCNGFTDGSITATFSGGDSPYQIDIDGGGFAAATSPKVFSNLGAGLHTVTVKDKNGCSDSKMITINQPDALTLSLAKTDVTCNGFSDGSVTATFGGGTAPYMVELDGGGFSTETSPKVFSGLGAGSHTVKVKDANGCTIEKSIDVSEASAVTLDLNKTDVTCNGFADGSITATFGGGTAPYQIDLDGGGYAAAVSPKLFGSLGPGSHTVTVKDANGCTLAKNITIDEPSAVTLSLSKTDVTCNGSADGSITATFGGGSAPYTVDLDGGGFSTETSPKVFSSLGPGLHTVTVKDKNGCTLAKDVTINEPDALTLGLVKTDVSCNGLSDGTITATFGGGTGPYTVDLDGGGFSTETSPKVFSSLGAGSHTVTVKDANGCTISKDITINQPDAVTLGLVKTDVSCNGLSDGTITATFGGGTGPYTVDLDGGGFSTETSPKVFSNLGPGSHTVTVKDANGCTLSKNATINEPDALTLDLTKTDVTCEGTQGTITATFGGGTGPYECQIDGGGFSTCSSPALFSGLGSGSHTIVIRDANLCTISKSATVGLPQCGQIAPTETTCGDFIAGTGGNITEICYGIKGQKINNAAPGVFFYYSKFEAPSSSFSVSVLQTKDNASFPYFGVMQDNQVYLYDGSCVKLIQGGISSPGQALINVTGVSAGQTLVIGVKYSTSTVVGTMAAGGPTVHYDFKTLVNGGVVDADPDGLDLRNCLSTITTTASTEPDAQAPIQPEIELYRPVPNPFAGTMRLAYAVSGPAAERVNVSVYDLSGRLVRTLATGIMEPGRYETRWDGIGENGVRVSNGVYFLRASVGTEVRKIRIALVR